MIINSMFSFLILKVGVKDLNKKGEFLFSVLSVSLITFLLTFFLKGVEVQLGLAIGLFAIFSIIRFRTSRIPIDQMSMIFLCMGVSVINSLNSNNIQQIPELLIVNFSVIIFVFIFKKIS